MTFTTISTAKEHMNITMQHYNIFIKWGAGGVGMACLKADMYYHGLNSLLCVAPWVSFPKGPYL